MLEKQRRGPGSPYLKPLEALFHVVVCGCDHILQTELPFSYTSVKLPVIEVYLNLHRGPFYYNLSILLLF